MKIYQILSNSERIHNSVGYSSVEICDNSLYAQSLDKTMDYYIFTPNLRV